jgi:hypothetical protein
MLRGLRIDFVGCLGHWRDFAHGVGAEGAVGGGGTGWEGFGGEFRDGVVAYVYAGFVLHMEVRLGGRFGLGGGKRTAGLTPLVVRGSSRPVRAWNWPLPPPSWLATAASLMVALVSAILAGCFELLALVGLALKGLALKLFSAPRDR